MQLLADGAEGVGETDRGPVTAHELRRDGPRGLSSAGGTTATIGGTGIPSSKTGARLLRFQRVRRLIETNPVRWADIAGDCGYCDQSHLNRDFRDLAGTTPGDYVNRRISAGPARSEAVTFVQHGGAGPG